ncbi:multinuclear nonheme iron-dependent oxidase [Lamprocystis purpurea]|uniref:multinuclear nonheme iron-dependent oxidase n=1 Tax=Lamprocystis purpurea TaxID=61598 RepID=UPI003899603E
MDFFEVHAENYLVPGGLFLRHLTQIRERFALSIHRPGPGTARSPAAVGKPQHLCHLRRIDTGRG